MPQADEQLVTGEFLGLFLVFGADIILVVVLLALAGVLPGVVAVAVTVLVLGGYGVWLGIRWRRLHDTTETYQPDPLETLKDRYAAGELSDEEFENRLDRLLNIEQTEESTSSERQEPHSPEYSKEEY